MKKAQKSKKTTPQSQPATKLFTSRYANPGVFVLVFAVAASAILIATHATSPNASIEPEKGTINSPALMGTDSGASSGQYVQFKAASGGTVGPRTVNVASTGTIRTANSSSTICSQISASSGGDTVEIANGSYGAISCSGKRATSDIIIKPASGATATIAGASISTSDHLMFVNINWTGNISLSSNSTTNGDNNITFEGGTSRVSSSTNNFDIGGGNTNLVIEDITMSGGDSHFNINSSNDANRTNGIYIRHDDSGWIVGQPSTKLVQDHIIINRGKNVYVQYNYITALQDSSEHSDGVQSVDTDGLWIENNIFSCPVADRDSYSDRNDHGIFLNDEPSTSRVTQNVHVSNNLIHDWIATGIAAGGCTNCEFFNNTVYDSGKNGTGTAVNFDPDPPSVTGAGYNDMTISLWNDAFENLSINSSHSTVSRNDHNLVGGSPGFVSPSTGNYAPSSSSPLINAGSATGAPTIDLFGKVRTGLPDIGAIEF